MVKDKHKKVEEKIAEIRKKCGNGDYIFRGESNRENPKIASTFYRNYETAVREERSPVNFSVNIERDVTIREAKDHFSIETPNIEILTELQHYDGNTSLIDFTKNFLVALFFACNGNRGKAGRVILLNITKLKEERNDTNAAKLKGGQNITYEEQEDYILVIPHSKDARIVAQSSVFVHARNGYIRDDDVGTEDIGSDIKDDTLDYLREYCNIHTHSIYNDTHGFIKNQQNYPTVRGEMLQGVTKFDERKYEDAEMHFHTVTELDPQHSGAYRWCGVAQIMQQKYQEAIPNLDRSIDISPKNIDVYFWRGMAKLNLGDYDSAMNIWNGSIRETISENEIAPIPSALQGLRHEMEGNQEEAQKEYQKATNLSLQHNIQEELEKLKENEKEEG